MFRKSNVYKTVFLVSLKYRVIKTIKKVTFYEKLCFIKSLKGNKKKLVRTSFYYVSQEIWLGSSKKRVCIDQLRFYMFLNPRELKNV